MKGTRIFLERVNFGRFVNMHMAVESQPNVWAVANPVTFTVSDEIATLAPPMMQFTPDQAQALMDELWTVGFRPTQGQQSEGQMGATTRHLEDMRAMVAALAKVQLP
ncbi:MAG: hypothetical protein WAW73_20325 [Rhodoferax sp.]